MPELGKHAAEVLAAYAGSITLLLLLVGLSVRRSRRVKHALERVESA